MRLSMCLFTSLLLFIILAGGCMGVTNARMPADPAEITAITKACMDYVEGYYQGSVDRVSTGCHPELTKRRIRDNALNTITLEKLLTGVPAQKGVPTGMQIKIDVYDVYGSIASAVIISGYVDYVHLAKIDNRWQVVNVLWDNKRS